MKIGNSEIDISRVFGFLTILVLMVFLAGCNEQQQVGGIKPLNQHLAPAPQDWKDAYGDTIETQVVFNTLVSRINEIKIADMVNWMHPSDVNDPNNLKARIEALENLQRWSNPDFEIVVDDGVIEKDCNKHILDEAITGSR